MMATENTCKTYDGHLGPLCITNINPNTNIDFGTIRMGCRGSVVYAPTNDNLDVRSFKVKRRKRARTLRHVFRFDRTTFTMRPKEKIELNIEFTPLKHFQTYVDYVYIYCQDFPVTQICLKGKSIGPYIVPSASEITLRTNMGTVVDSKLELCNYSSAPAEFYFDVDIQNSLFRFDPARSIIGGGETSVIRIEFKPPFEGTVEKQVFCFVENQEPLSFHMIGVSGRCGIGHNMPTIRRHPGLPAISKRRSTLEAYVHREWEAVLEILPQKIIKISGEDLSSCFQVRNKTDTSFTLVWSPDSQRRFSIDPMVCHLLPRLEANFRVTKGLTAFQKPGRIAGYGIDQGVGMNAPSAEDSAASAVVDGWLFWNSSGHTLPSKSQPWQDCQRYINETWQYSLMPVNFEVSFLGLYNKEEICVPLPGCEVVPVTMIFPVQGHTEDLYASFLIRTDSHHRLLYNIIAPKTGEFLAKPMEGVVNNEFRVIVVGRIPRFKHLIHLERWTIALDGREADMANVDLLVTDVTLNVKFGELGDIITFPPVMLGNSQETTFMVHNNSPFWVQLSCNTNEIPSTLNIGEAVLSIGPHDKISLRWEYQPTAVGLNSEIITYTAKEVRSPDVEELLDKVLECTLEKSREYLPATNKALTKDDFEGKKQEYKISVEILCRNIYPLMQPPDLLIADFIMTQPAAGTFTLINAMDAPVPFSLSLQNEPFLSMSLDPKIDPSFLVNNSEYEISPSQGILEPHQARNFQCIFFSREMSHRRYSIIMEITQRWDYDTDGGANCLSPKKIGTITCKGAWPEVKISYVKALVNDEFFNPVILWKCLSIDKLNEALKFHSGEHKKEIINMVFPEQPLHSKPIVYKMKVQNLSAVPVTWEVHIQHGVLEMPPLQITSPVNKDNISSLNDGLEHLKALVQQLQSTRLGIVDTSEETFLRTIQCCQKQGAAQWDSAGHRVPPLTQECPLQSVIHISPEKGFIMPGGAEILTIEVRHELEGEFTFHYNVRFEIADQEYIAEKEAMKKQALRDLGKATGAIPKSRNPCHRKASTNKSLDLERSAEYHNLLDEHLSKEMQRFHLEPVQPALIVSSVNCDSTSEESEAFQPAGSSVQPCTLLQQHMPFCVIPQNNNISFPLGNMSFEGNDGEDSIASYCEGVSTSHRNPEEPNTTINTPSEKALFSLWSPDFDLDSTTDSGSTQKLSQGQCKALLSVPTYQGIPSPRNIASPVLANLYLTKTLNSYHSDDESLVEGGVALLEAQSRIRNSPSYGAHGPVNTQDSPHMHELPYVREDRGQKPTKNHSANPFLLSSDEEVSDKSSTPRFQSEEKYCNSSGITSHYRKRRHSEPVLSVKQMEIRPMHHIRSLSLGHVNVSTKKTHESSFSSSDSQCQVKHMSIPLTRKAKDMMISDRIHLTENVNFRRKNQKRTLSKSKFSQCQKWRKWIFKKEMTDRGPVCCPSDGTDPLKNKRENPVQPCTQRWTRHFPCNDAESYDVAASTPSTASQDELNMFDLSPRRMDFKRIEGVEEDPEYDSGCSKLRSPEKKLKGKRGLRLLNKKGDDSLPLKSSHKKAGKIRKQKSIKIKKSSAKKLKKSSAKKLKNLALYPIPEKERESTAPIKRKGLSSKSKKSIMKRKNQCKRKGFKSIQCVPLGDCNESHGYMYALNGKESCTSEQEELNFETLQMNHSFQQDIDSNSKHRYVDQTGNKLPSMEDSSGEENDQMISDRMKLRRPMQPDAAIASRFDLCEQTEYQCMDHAAISLNESQELNLILSNLVVETDDKSTSQHHLTLPCCHKTAFAAFPPGPSLANDIGTSIPQSKLEKHKLWRKPQPPITSEVKLRVTIRSYDENKEEKPMHPYLYADKIALSDVSIVKGSSPYQVTWLYNPLQGHEIPFNVVNMDDCKRDDKETFTCINPAGLIFPKSMFPLIIHFQPKEVGLHKGGFEIICGSNSMNMPVEGRGVPERQQHFHNIETGAPIMSLIMEPEMPFWLSDERIIVTRLISRTSKALRLVFIVNKTNLLVSFQWKSMTSPSNLDCFVDVSVTPSNEILSPYQVLPLLLHVSKTKNRLCPIKLGERGKEKLQCCAVHSRLDVPYDCNADSSIQVDCYPLNCTVTCPRSSIQSEVLTGERIDIQGLGGSTETYHKSLFISFGTCLETSSQQGNGASPERDEIAVNRLCLVPKIQHRTLQCGRILTMDDRSLRSIREILEGLPWRLLNSSWFSNILGQLLMEGTHGCTQGHSSVSGAIESGLECTQSYYVQILTKTKAFEEPTRDEPRDITTYSIPQGLMTQIFEETILRNIVSISRGLFTDLTDTEDDENESE